MEFHVKFPYTKTFAIDCILSTTYGMSFDKEQTFRSAKEAASRPLPT